MSYYGWKPYVPVAERRAKALRKIKKLKKQGMHIQPVEIATRKIATTFWGKAWCNHIKSFSDYENRLPRGRTYVRNGSVCHLAIEQGKISAIVSGSSLYNVEINIKPLPSEQWLNIKTKCSGQIGSLIELLSGKLSDNVMNAVCHQQQGLFPTPSEISLSCSCPDWATMCKHVTAVLYGVAARLDHSPHQLFLLRGVNHEELIDVSTVISDVTQKGKSKRKRIDDTALTDVFGIEIENKNETETENKDGVETNVEKSVSNKEKAKQLKNQSMLKKSLFPKHLTGADICKKRKSLRLTQAAFANIIGVSPTRISQWEHKGRKRLNPKKVTKKNLQKIW